MTVENKQNQIAVITGAASGIGKALAVKAAQEGMRVVIADIAEAALEQTELELKLLGAETLSCLLDVTKEDEVNQLAEHCVKHFGIPHLLFNNAGVGGLIGPLWEIPTIKLRWMLEINLMGIVHGVRAFVPLMQRLNAKTHIINTSSMAGLYTAPYISCYQISKHAVVALTEALYHDLRVRKSNISVHLLLPGWVKTNILNSERFCPSTEHEVPYDNYTEEDAKWISNFAKSVKKGDSPEVVAERVFEALEENKFYIFTDTDMKENIRNRMLAILEEDDPAQMFFRAL